MSLIDEVKSYFKEDVDIGDIETKLSKYEDLSVVSKDNIIDVFKKHPDAFSALDSVVGTRAEKRLETYKEKELPNEWKSREEAIRAELNPKETPAEKRIRELEAKIEAQENKEKLSARQDELSVKAKDLGFEPLLARKLAKLEDADSVIQDVLDWHNGILGTKIKGQYDQKPPRSGGIEKGLSNMSNSELYAAAKADPANKAAILEEVNRRMRPT
jgi:hypothetical protein